MKNDLLIGVHLRSSAAEILFRGLPRRRSLRYARCALNFSNRSLCRILRTPRQPSPQRSLPAPCSRVLTFSFSASLPLLRNQNGGLLKTQNSSTLTASLHFVSSPTRLGKPSQLLCGDSKFLCSSCGVVKTLP